jgi:hypothetical protein
LTASGITQFLNAYSAVQNDRWFSSLCSDRFPDKTRFEFRKVILPLRRLRNVYLVSLFEGLKARSSSGDEAN